jgi:hypothetical protein
MIFSACTEEIDLGSELPNDIPTLAVVEALVSTDTMAHVVKLTWSKDLNDDQAPDPITGAQITISGNNQEIPLNEVEPGHYYTPDNYYVVSNERYYLTIDNVDTDNDGTSDRIVATDSVPTQPLLDSIQVEWIDQWEAWQVNCFAQENADETNFYFFRAYVNSHLVTDTLLEYTLADDYFINGMYITGLDAYYLNEEDQDEVLANNDTVTLEIAGISEAAYDFMIQAQTEVGFSAPLFSGPPSNVDQNIEGKNAFGIFMVYSNHKKSAVYEE